jgi:hypothetical protein
MEKGKCEISLVSLTITFPFPPLPREIYLLVDICGAHNTELVEESANDGEVGMA